MSKKKTKSKSKSRKDTNGFQKLKSPEQPAPEVAETSSKSKKSRKGRHNKKSQAAKHQPEKAKGKMTNFRSGPAPRQIAGWNSRNVKQFLNRQVIPDFHPAVTSASAKDIQKAGDAFIKACASNNRPTRDEYVAGNVGFNHGNYTYSKFLVKALLDANGAEPQTSENGTLGKFVSSEALNLDMATSLASDGFKTLENLAIADRASWVTLTQEMAIYDCVATAFLDVPRGKVFLAISPEHSVADSIRAMETPSDKWNPNPAVDWAQDDFDNRDFIIDRLTGVYKSCGHAPPPWGKEPHDADEDDPEKLDSIKCASNFYGSELVRGIRAILPTYLFDQTHQEVLMPENVPWRQSNMKAVSQISSLITAIYRRKNTIEVLHFQKIPMLDRRLVAAILKGCPNVRMIGIYDCPLIHFGDVICLLDLINEINKSRRQNDLPEIEALDFYPNYNYGMPYQHPCAATYGLTWSPRDEEVVRRGFFKILLEACLKSRQMGIKLLFDENHAFRKYISRIPAVQDSVPYYLDGLFRYLDVLNAQNPDGQAKERAMNDMLKCVNKNLEPEGHGLPKNLPPKTRLRLQHQLYFCSSCGYEMGQQFFTFLARGDRPHLRVCAGCILQATLDREMDHNKMAKRMVLDTLFPNWDAGDFNDDAPLDGRGKGLINLSSNQRVRPAPPPLQVGADGVIFRRAYKIPLVRDNKVHYDSLQNLPDLEFLASITILNSAVLWSVTMFDALKIDFLQITCTALNYCFPWKQGDLSAFSSTRVDSGFPDHLDERQPRPPFPLLAQSQPAQSQPAPSQSTQARRLGPEDNKFW